MSQIIKYDFAANPIRILATLSATINKSLTNKVKMDSVFFPGVSLILLHEMDAVRCHEWRIFPGLSMLKEGTGFLVFMVLHIPLFVWVLMAMSDAVFRRGFDIFLVIHLGLHLLFLNHLKNEFKDWISWAIIAGAAIFGAIDLILSNKVIN